MGRIAGMVLAGLMASTPSMAGSRWDPIDQAIESYNQSVKAIDEQRHDDALARVDEALRIDPECDRCRIAKMAALVALNRSAEAVEVGRHVTTAHPKSSTAWAGYAAALFLEERPEESRDAAQNGLAVGTDQDEVLAAASIYLQALLRLGDTDTALAMLRAQEAKYPDPIWSCWRVRAHAEAQDLDAAAAAMPRCEQYSDPARIALAKRFLEMARGEHTAAGPSIDGQPIPADARTGALIEAGDDKGAEASARAQLRSEPKNQIARSQLGIALYNQERYAEAAVELAAAVHGQSWVQAESGGITGIVTASLEKQRAAYTARVSRTYLTTLVLLGRHAEARTELVRLREQLGPTTSLALAEAQIIGAESGSSAGWKALLKAAAGAEVSAVQTGQGALAHLHREPVPEDVLLALPTPANSRAIIAFNREQWSACVAVIERGLRAEPEATQELLGLGLGCHGRASGDLDQAETWLAAVSDRSVVHPSALFNLGLRFSNAGRHERALDALANGPWTDPRDVSDVNNLRITSLVELGRLDEAIAIATSGPARVQTVLWLSGKVGDAGKPKTALALVEQYCPKATGEDEKFCEENIGAFREMAE